MGYYSAIKKNASNICASLLKYLNINLDIIIQNPPLNSNTYLQSWRERQMQSTGAHQEHTPSL
jgi:hypothetical protein